MNRGLASLVVWWCVVAAVSRAQTPDDFFGLEASPISSWAGNANDLLFWVDGEYRLQREFGAVPGDLCRNTLDGGAVRAATGQYFTALATRPGNASVYALTLTGGTSYQVERLGCPGGPTLIGVLDVGAGNEVLRGGALTPSSDALIYVSTSGLARVSLSPSLAITTVVTRVAIAQAIGLPVGEASGLSLSPPVIANDGTVLGLATRPAAGTNGQTDIWGYSVDLSGAVRIQLRTRQLFVPPLLWVAEFDAALFGMDATIGLGEAFPAWAVLRAGVPLAAVGGVEFVGRSSPTANLAYFTVVPGRQGLYALASSAARRVKIQLQFADFDRDGLSAATEADAGLSDFIADFDLDGFSDGYERDVAKTDPKSAASAPISSSADELVFAPSTLASTGAPYTVDRYPDSLQQTCTGPSCVLIDGGLRVYDFFAERAWFAEGGRQVLYPKNGADQLWWRDLDTGFDQPLAGAQAVAPVIPFGMVSGFTTYWGAQGRPSPGWRSDADGGVFAFFDAARPTCPLLGAASDLSACDEFARQPSSQFRLLGYDETRDTALITLGNESHTELFALGHDRPAQLTDLAGPSSMLPALWARHLPAKGWLVGGNTWAARFDDAFRELPLRQEPMDLPGHWYRRGFVGRRVMRMLQEPRGASNPCSSNGMIFVCDKEGLSPMAKYVNVVVPAEWVPMEPALAPGELVAWAPRPRLDVLRKTVEPTNNPNWSLLRVGRSGGVLPWLDWPQFEALLPSTDRLASPVDELKSINHIAVSPDGRRICLSEPLARRTWELLLGADRRPSAARVASRSTGTACEYDASGQLVLLDVQPTTLRTATGVVSVPALTTPDSLVRVGSTWVVSGQGEVAQCIGDDGVVRASGVTAQVVAEALGHVAYVDADGFGFLSSVEAFCSGAGPSERMWHGGLTVWWELYRTFTPRRVTAHGGSMAVRPDGVVFVAPRGLTFGEFSGTEFQVPLLFHAFPTWEPLDWSKRTLALDPFRRAVATSAVADLSLVSVATVALVPGADATGDWGYDVRPGPLLVEPADGGEPMADAGTEPPMRPTGCSCSADPAALWCMASAWLALSRRRRQRNAVISASSSGLDSAAV